MKGIEGRLYPGTELMYFWAHQHPQTTLHSMHASILIWHKHAINSVQFSHSVMSDSLWPCGLQHSPVHHQLLELAQTHVPRVGDDIKPSHSLLSPSPPVFNLFFTSGGQSIGVPASASVLPVNIQGWFPLGLTGWISLCLRDSQESSPTPQFRSIYSSALSFLHSPTLTSIHDHCKNHSLD